MSQVPLLSLGEYARLILRLMEEMATHPDASPRTRNMLHVAGIGVKQAARRIREEREAPGQRLHRVNLELRGEKTCKRQ